MSPIPQPRRTFLQTGLAGFCTALFASLPHWNFARSGFGKGKGIVVRESEGIHILTRKKVPITIKISKARQGVENISFCTEEMIPGRKMRIHKHLHNDELIFIHKGQGTLTLDEETISVGAGDVAFVPSNTWHGLDNTGGESLIMVFQYSPAGFEAYFIENGTPDGMLPVQRSEEAYRATEKKYGMVYRDSQ